MNEPLTEDMLTELLKAENAQSFCSAHSLSRKDLPQYLEQLLAEKQLKRPAVIKEAGINSTFGYQIFTGARGASRDNLIKLAFAMKLSLREAQRLLQAGHTNALYCKNRRDAIIIFAINKGYSLQKAQEELYRFGEGTID